MRYTAIPQSDLPNDIPVQQDLGLKVAKWVFVYDILRTVVLVALTALNIDATIITDEPRLGIYQGGKNVWTNLTLVVVQKAGELSYAQKVELGVTLFYTLNLILSILILSWRRDSTRRRQVRFALHTLLLIAWGIYAYRDLFPLITYSRLPLDPDYLPESLVWARFSLLTIVAVLIPLFQPNQYRPVDPVNPSDEPNEEQTASFFSYVFYIFMDKIVFRAWKSPAIPYEQLPSLPDYDRAGWLARHNLLKLHPIRRQELGLKPRGLFTCLMSVFWKPYMILAIMIIIQAVMDFAAPIGINRLLTYVESGETNDIRPWFWILWLFLGPTFASLARQYYIFTTTRSLVHVESLFTQLLFDHALRIKMQDPVDSAPSIEEQLQGANTPAPIVDGPGLEETHIPIVDNNTAGLVAVEAAEISSDEQGQPEKPDSSDSEKAAGLVGRLTTLASTDLENMIEGRDFLMMLLYAPIQLILGGVFLYQILSWSGLVGMALTFVTLPVPGYLAKLMNTTQRNLMKATDDRIQTITEAVSTLRMVKLFAWEEQISQRISEKRKIELRQVRIKGYIDKIIGTVNWILPILTMIACYGLFTGVEKRVLTAAQVFSSLTVFDMIRNQMYGLTAIVQSSITAKVSVERFDAFLRGTELLDVFKNDVDIKVKTTQEQNEIYMKNAEFSWDSPATTAAKERRSKSTTALASGTNTARGTATARSKKEWRLKIDDLVFPQGKTTVVAGKTSSGKTSLLMALLGEMNWVPTQLDASFNLPRAGGIAYCAQEAWVMATTVRENIVFGEVYDEKRYKQVLHACALEKDLELFDAGDQTELGEKGLNASGGQKARISLARAVYSSANILLLDSVLEALDVTTSRWIVEKLFKGDLLQDRTVILVTHHVALLAPVTDYIVHMAVGGTIDHQGPIDQMNELIEEQKPEETEAQEPLIEDIEECVSQAQPEEKAPAESTDGSAGDSASNLEAGKLVSVEEKGEGRVSRHALLEYFKLAGGPVWWFIYFLVVFIGEILYAGCNWWLGRWTLAYEEASDPRSVSIVYWLGMYVALMVLQVCCYNWSSLQWLFGALRASQEMHAKLVHKILHAPMRFLDKTPTGRILGRFTKDINSIDGSVIDLWQGICEIAITLVIKAIIVVWIVPIFGPIGLAIGIIGFGLAELYIHGQLSVKREMSNAKTPLYTSFNSAVHGVVSIRAYGAEQFFAAQLRERVDKYTRCCVTFYNLNRWITVRMDVLGGLFSVGVASLLLYGGSNILPAYKIGLAINQAVSFSGALLYFVRIINGFEVQANGIERINDYFQIEQEPAPTEAGKPPASWPQTGEVKVENLKARYYDNGPVVLDDISFDIPAGSRVGIVGRTGSGKSSLTLALLRVIPTEGSIKIAGLDTRKINLNALRSAITIIPQDPVLLSGSLRFNLDPFDEHEDYELNQVIKTSGLEMEVAGMDGEDESSTSALTLDSPIASGGSNLSAGQRQLVALARALVRGSKILVLDEATASVDHTTDGLVQKAIRNLHDVTLIVVAHRLSTIADSDKILVLGAGKLLEYDSPKNLLENKSSHYYALCNDSHEREHLVALANGTAQR